MKSTYIVTLLSVLTLFATSVIGGDVPNFYKNTYPEHALKAALEARNALMGKDAKLDAKTRNLIALGVAAQIPCSYCVYVHNKNAIAAGASEAEIREAVAVAGHVRNWSTVLNGMGYDFDTFRSEVDKIHAAK